MPQSDVFCMDCMDGLRTTPDKYYDLAIVDPPYGGGRSQNIQVERERERESQAQDCAAASDSTRENTGHASASGLRSTISASRMGGRTMRYNPQGGVFSNRELGDHFVPRGRGKKYQQAYGGADIRYWDVAPTKEYFDELARVSKNQIIWGANYFSLPPTRCFLVWRKTNIPLEGFSMAQVEYAWTSFNDNARFFEFSSARRENAGKVHPTEKPIELYAWILRYFAKPGYKILDTHMGSQSSRIAAWDAGLDYTGYEIDETYFKTGCERFDRHSAQTNLFLENGL